MVHRHSATLAIVSVLKPVDDIRMYRKFARSLVDTDEFGVNIIGFRSKANPQDDSVAFSPIFDFPRLSVRRLGANYCCYRTLLRTAPSIIILTTPELYPAVAWYQRQRSVTVVYDMVENYQRNIRHNQGFARSLVTLLTGLVAWAERKLLLMSDLIILAERGYQQELALPAGKPVIVVENKALRTSPGPLRRPCTANAPLSLVYTGTVSEVYGIKLALDLVRQLIAHAQLQVGLTVMGHVPLISTFDWLNRYAQEHSWLDLRISTQPVPHEDIVSLIQSADFGIVSHQPVPSIEHCFPTRIWEYMAYRLPFLLQDHSYWTNYCAPWHCAIPLDFGRPDLPIIKQKMLNTTFYPQGVPEDIWWKSEGQKLRAHIRGLLIRPNPTR